jgi:hypothetical protein
MQIAFISQLLYNFFIKEIKRENIFTATEARFLSNAPTQNRRLTPDSCQKQTPPDRTIGTTLALFAFLATRVATVRTKFALFRTNSALIQASVTVTG